MRFKLSLLSRVVLASLLLFAMCAVSLTPGSIAGAQSGRQPPQKKVEKKTEGQKSDQPSKAGKEPEETGPPLTREQRNEPPIKLSTQVVNVEVSVMDKKTHRLITNLTKKNFVVYEDGLKQEVTNFAPGEGPMTVVLLIDNGYQNRYFRDYFTPTTYQEIFRSAAAFVQGFVKPNDFVALVTFSLKPKVIQDFTGDRQKLYGALMSASQDTLNFSESNIYDGVSFALLGGKAIQLYDENAGPSEYTGLQEIEGHTAVLLITTGIDTFSRLTYDKTLKIIERAGVPIFPVSVGNLFYKKYEHLFSPEARLTYLQAQNGLETFARYTGGMFFPMTFEGEIPSIMRSIEALLRTQYSLGYTPSNTRRAGKERKIKVEVDVDGDGKPDNDKLDLRFRERYVEPDDTPPKK